MFDCDYYEYRATVFVQFITQNGMPEILGFRYKLCFVALKKTQWTQYKIDCINDLHLYV